MDPVTVIYGHNMGKTGTMFTELHKYEEREFFDANPYIYIYLPSGRLKYQIFAAVAFDNRYILGSYNFSDSEDVSKYISELKACFQGNVNDGADIRNPIILPVLQVRRSNGGWLTLFWWKRRGIKSLLRRFDIITQNN